MQSTKKLMILMCVQHWLQPKSRILFFLVMLIMHWAVSSRKLCCQLRSLRPCPSSASHMDLALANNAGWASSEGWEETLECELQSPATVFAIAELAGDHRFQHLAWASGSPQAKAVSVSIVSELCSHFLVGIHYHVSTHKTQCHAETARSCESLWWTPVKEETYSATAALHVFVFPPVDLLV